jgi:aldose 1-epimerase
MAMATSHRAGSPSGHQYEITQGAARATIVEVGGGLRTLQVDGREVLDGYPESAMCPDGRGQVLIPWPNRLDHGRYEWDGLLHQAALNEPENSNAIHGLVRFAEWECVSMDADRVEMAHTLWPCPGYPFMLELRIAYTLDDDGLTVRTTARNVGTEPAPYGAGQHPYLRPPSGGSVDACELSIPAERYLPTDERGLPTGTEAVEGTAYDFRLGRRIGDALLDVGFAELARRSDGRAWVEIAEPGMPTFSVWLDEGFPYVQVFTGDTVADVSRRRRSVAVEPMTCPANAFATGTGVQRLEPGDTHTATWGVVI